MQLNATCMKLDVYSNLGEAIELYNPAWTYTNLQNYCVYVCGARALQIAFYAIEFYIHTRANKKKRKKKTFYKYIITLCYLNIGYNRPLGENGGKAAHAR